MNVKTASLSIAVPFDFLSSQRFVLSHSPYFSQLTHQRIYTPSQAIHHAQIVPEPQGRSHPFVSTIILPATRLHQLNSLLCKLNLLLTSLPSHAPKSAVSNALATTIRSKYPSQSHANFNVEITEHKPTPDQLRIIQRAKGAPAGFEAPAPPEAAEGAAGASHSAVADLEDSKTNKVPILVDWDNGTVAVDDESQALRILQAKAQESN